jgi:rubredoxin
MSEDPSLRLMCLGCGFSYDEALGLPEHGIAPGTVGRTSPKTGCARIAARPNISSSRVTQRAEPSHVCYGKKGFEPRSNSGTANIH